MKWIDEFKYGTVTEGSNSGTIALQINFTGETPTKEDVIYLIKRIEDHDKGLFRNISFTGKYPENPQSLITLTRMLQNHGYLVQATIDGDVYHQWLGHVNWIVAELKEPVWAGFIVHELRLHFKENLIEPSESLKIIPTRFLILDKESDKKEVFKFLKGAKKPWGILLRNTGVFE